MEAKSMDFYPNEIINEGVVKLRIDAVGGELDKIVDRYPRSFLEEMARQRALITIKRKTP